jgi:peptide/nickel transport system permease protein
MKFRASLRADPLAGIALVVLILLVLVSVGALLIPGLDGRVIVGARLQTPSWAAPLGTDSLGRNMLPRLLEGVRTTVLISAVAVVVSTALAAVLGIAAGLVGGAVDAVVMRLADGLFAFPAVLLGIVVSAIVGSGPPAAVVSIIIITLPLMLRIFRSATVDVVHLDFITASTVGGAGRVRLAVRHIAPNVAGSIAVQATYAASVAMLVEGAISFLGFGVVPPGASLGSLVQDGAIYLTVAPWLALAPGAVLAIAILCVNLVGDAMRDTLEPREERALS